jgi:catechol 2,3-dioxygenase
MASPITHAQLRVADLARSLAFYRDLLGFDVTADNGATVTLGPAGAPAARLTLREVRGAKRRPNRPRTAGLYHVAWLVPSRPALGRALDGLVRAKYPLTGAADHWVSESLYLDDPDGNGVEIYADTPRERWQWTGDRVAMAVDPLDLNALLADRATEAPGSPLLPQGTEIGHVHFTVGDLAAAIAACEAVGMARTFESPALVGLSVDRYHHHVNLNTWAGAGAPPDDPGTAGLDQWTFRGQDFTEGW